MFFHEIFKNQTQACRPGEIDFAKSENEKTCRGHNGVSDKISSNFVFFRHVFQTPHSRPKMTKNGRKSTILTNFHHFFVTFSEIPSRRSLRFCQKNIFRQIFPKVGQTSQILVKKSPKTPHF